MEIYFRECAAKKDQLNVLGVSEFGHITFIKIKSVTKNFYNDFCLLLCL